eukprot:2705679-Pyramimonas_sp.AAC.1
MAQDSFRHASKTPQEGHKTVPGWPKKAPRGVQEAPKTAPRAPRIASRAPQEAILVAPEGGANRGDPLL